MTIKTVCTNCKQKDKESKKDDALEEDNEDEGKKEELRKDPQLHTALMLLKGVSVFETLKKE